MKLIKIIQERGMKTHHDCGRKGLERVILADTTLKVECSSVMADIDRAIPEGQIERHHWGAIPCCVPPMSETWVEYSFSHGQAGSLFERVRRADGGFDLDISLFFSEKGDAPLLIGTASGFRLKSSGSIDTTVPTRSVSYTRLSEEIQQGMVYPMLHAIARMHCKNIKLSPVGQPKQPGWTHDELPGKFLREIVITSLPQTRSTGRSIFRSERMLREHWVRGHYADYRTHGLFGKIKGLFWIPEHKAGSAALGKTEHQYRIAS